MLRIIVLSRIRKSLSVSLGPCQRIALKREENLSSNEEEGKETQRQRCDCGFHGETEGAKGEEVEHPKDESAGLRTEVGVAVAIGGEEEGFVDEGVPYRSSRWRERDAEEKEEEERRRTREKGKRRRRRRAGDEGCRG
jgi:hypothetical protein